MLEKNLKKMNNLKEKLLCVWDTGAPCKGEIKKRNLFESKCNNISTYEFEDVPLCGSHLDYHKAVMFLYINNWEVDKIMDMNIEEMVLKMNILKLSGVKLEKEVL